MKRPALAIGSAVLVATGALGALVQPACAQEIIAVLQPPEQGEECCNKVVLVGDENGDGVSELAVPDHFGDHVIVFDGAFGDVRHDLSLGAWNEDFGGDADGADLDGDGLADLAVSSWLVEKVRLMSGLDGHLINTFDKDSRRLTFVGDVDGDGMPDLMVSDFYFDWALMQAGHVRVFSSATGNTLYKDDGGAIGDSVGFRIAGPGDLDGDGVPDVAYAGSGALDDGAVLAASAVSGQLLWTTDGVDPETYLGESIAPAGDVDLDGTPDLIVGDFASARVLSGATGGLISLAPASHSFSNFAVAVCGAGDVNADGHPDFAASVDNWPWGGNVGLYDGITGRGLGGLPIFEWPGGWYLGFALDGPADVNSDGVPDVVLGAPAISFPYVQGRVMVASVGDVPWNYLVKSISWLTHSAVLRIEGVPVADSKVLLKLAGGPPQAFAWLVVGGGARWLPLLGGVLVPNPEILIPLTLDAQGRATVEGRWPTVVAGIQPTLQAWISDPSGPEGWTASNALATGP